MEKVSYGLDMFEEFFMLDGVDYGVGNRASQWAAAEGCAMHARGEGEGGVVGAEHRSHGNAVGDWLGQRCDVGQDTVVLVGKPFSGAADTALNFVGEEEGSGGVA